VLRTAAALLLTLTLAACATVDVKDPFARIPRRSLEGLRSALPEPSAERSFVLDGDIEYVGRADKGRYRLSCEAGAHDGEPAWYLVEEIDDRLFPGGEPKQPTKRTFWLSRELFVLRGDLAAAPGEERADAVGTLPGVLLLFRLCPAEVAAYGEPPACPYVADVSADGRMTCAAPTEGRYGVHVALRAADRAPIEIVRWLGWHKLGRIVPRTPFK
jgi:hypothetical protein